MRKLLSCLLIGLFCFSAHAEIKQTLGPWDVHYIVFPSTFLTPEIAKANGLVRSKFNAVVNISVLDKDTKEAQVYYLAPLAYRDRETYRFKITINDRGQKEVLEFQQQMYVD